MTDRTEPTLDNAVSSRQLPRAGQFAGGSDEGWIVPSANDPGNVATDNGDINEGQLDAFSETSSTSSFDVTIAPGQAYIGGRWLARDVDTTVTLASSTNNQSVYVGVDVDVANTVIVGLDSAFATQDPKHEIWQFDTDGSGVTSATDQRNLDDYRVRSDDLNDVETLSTSSTTQDEVPTSQGNGELQMATIAGAFDSVDVLTSDQSYDTSDIDLAFVQVVGGGGGGGGVRDDQNESSGGGGAGAYDFDYVDLSATSSVSVIVGDGGTGQSGSTNGNSGNNSEFGALVTATGGAGGSSTANGGGGGSGGAGIFNGGDGADGSSLPSTSIWKTPSGGASAFGSQSASIDTSAATSGANANTIGGGGGGAFNDGASSGGSAGGDGAAGIVIVHYRS